MPAKTTPKDVFLHLLMMVMLYIVIISLITMSFAYVDYIYPDYLIYYNGAMNSMRLSSAMLIVSFPLFLFLSWIIQKDFRNHPDKHDLRVRKWLVYLTLFVTAITIVIDLILLIENFYSGELTLPFSLKVISVLLLTGAVFGYYLWDVQSEPHKSKIPFIAGCTSSVLVIVMIVTGFFLIGSPMKQRAIRMDEQRLRDLQALQNQIMNYWQYKNVLPAQLDDLTDNIKGFKPPVDPITKAPYGYTVVSITKFKLCATFKHPNTNENYRNPSYYPGYLKSPWNHKAGYICFDKTIDPSLYNTGGTTLVKPVPVVR